MNLVAIMGSPRKGKATDRHCPASLQMVLRLGNQMHQRYLTAFF